MQQADKPNVEVERKNHGGIQEKRNCVSGEHCPDLAGLVKGMNEKGELHPTHTQILLQEIFENPD